jgi:hypothetical protein
MSGLRQYHPATDPDFVTDVVNHLRRSEGQWTHPGRVVLEMRGAECDAVILAVYTYKAVLVARRLGDRIEGDTQLGYRYTGYERVRFVNVEWASRWPDVPAEDRPHRRRRLLGQLSIAEAVS